MGNLSLMIYIFKSLFLDKSPLIKNEKSDTTALNSAELLFLDQVFLFVLRYGIIDLMDFFIGF